MLYHRLLYAASLSFSNPIEVVKETLDPEWDHDEVTYSNSNRSFVYDGSGARGVVRSLNGKNGGKWYFEVVTDTVSSSNYTVGITANHFASKKDDTDLGQSIYEFGYRSDGATYREGSFNGSAGLDSYTDGSVIGVAVDLDGGTVSFYNENVFQRTYSSANISSEREYYASSSCFVSNEAGTFNFHSDDLTYSPPSGYSAWDNESIVYDLFDIYYHGNNVSLNSSRLEATCSTPSSAGWQGAKSHKGKESSKWYMEFEALLPTTGNKWAVGITTYDINVDTQPGIKSTEMFYYSDGTKFSSNTSSAYGDSWAQGDIIGLALDMDNGKVWFSKNGVWQNSGDPINGTNPAFSSITGLFYPGVGLHSDGSTGSDDASIRANFGATAFTYSVPTGFNSGWY